MYNLATFMYDIVIWTNRNDSSVKAVSAAADHFWGMLPGCGEQEREIMQNVEQLFREDLNPTFLFTCKGLRTVSEEKYHCHDFLELAFILSGNGKYKIDGQVYDVKEGDLLIFNQGTYHQAIVKEKEGGLMEVFLAATDIHLGGLEMNHLPLTDGCVLHTMGELKLKLTKLFASIEAEQDGLKPGMYHMLKAYLMQILLHIVREQTAALIPGDSEHTQKRYAFESTGKTYVVERIIDYFENHYAEKISLDQIALNMYLSPFYISKIFKSETGDTPISYLINIRLERAMEILKAEEELSIQEVALRVGYEDAYHFSKLFKKKFGVSPSAVRKRA